MRRLIKVEILTACAIIPPALELLPASRVFAALNRLPARSRAAVAPAPEHVAAAVDRVLRRLPGPWRHTCLRRATVLTALLRRDGRDAEVVLGVRRKETGEIEAHAWVRCDGVEPFLEPEQSPDQAFSVLRRPESAR